MTKQISSPIGGASLECLLGYESLKPIDLREVVARLRECGWGGRDEPPVFGVDEANIPVPLEWRDVGAQAYLRSVGARLRVRFAERDIDLVVIADLHDGVLSVSVPEDLLWMGDLSSLSMSERMLDFFRLCGCVTSWRQPTTIAVGSEPAAPSELRVRDNSVPERYRYTDQSLSTGAADDLVRWYADVYMKRW